MKKLTLLFVALFTYINVSIASPFDGEIKKFKQPDGTSVDLKLFGTEFYMRAEGLDGYTLIRDTKTNWICYATLSADKSKLVSTGIVYQGIENNASTFKTNLGFEKHLDVSEEARKKIIKENTSVLGYKKEKLTKGNSNQKIMTTPIIPVAGLIKGLCIVVDFSDQPGTLPMSEFDAFCNDLSYSNFGNNGSLRKYYKDISGGLVDYQNVVYGYYRAPKTFAQYDAMPYAQGAQEILGLALNWINSTGFDFSTLSINPDGSIQAINLMYTGTPPTWAQGMWHHRGWYTAFSADGVHSTDYNCSPANSPLGIAVVAHENGHMIGKWPDTYKYGTTTGPDGIGTFDLMCSYGSSQNPVPANPLFRNNVGWGKIVDVTGYNGLNVDTANSMTSYRYRNVNDTNEFFLFENRMKTGRSTSIPDQGVTVWHIDRNGDNQTLHHEAWLVHANNVYSNQSAACFKGPIKPVFSNTTTANSNWYNGDPSGLKIWSIGTPTTNLNYKIGNFTTGPSLHVLYNNIVDNNANGSLEPLESADITVSALNLGQVNSANATVTCTAIGANAGYVTVNTAPITIGVINVSQNIPTLFNITIAGNTPVGTEIELKFNLSDGSNSIYITKKYIVGTLIPIDNTNSTTCSAMFYDAGIESNYTDNTFYVKTFYPLTAGQLVAVNFLSFDVEDEPSCYYDYLQIYDGPNTSSPLLGTFCGTVNPGQFVSTDASGALTFLFYSDADVVTAGWKAAMSCVSTTGIKNTNPTTYFAITPNPSTGVFTVVYGQHINSEVFVLDVLGKEVMKQRVDNSSHFNIDLSEYTNGVYFVKLNTGEQIITHKVILNK